MSACAIVQVCQEAVQALEDSIKRHKLSYVDEEVLVELVSESQLGEALTGDPLCHVPLLSCSGEIIWMFERLQSSGYF